MRGRPAAGADVTHALPHNASAASVARSGATGSVGFARVRIFVSNGRSAAGIGTLLFVDEIHRFNRAQQDGFLPYVEDGTVTLIGATTENPSFELNAALLSRCQVLVLRRLALSGRLGRPTGEGFFTYDDG